MGSTLSLSLTNELRAFVDGQSGDGTFYAHAREEQFSGSSLIRFRAVKRGGVKKRHRKSCGV